MILFNKDKEEFITFKDRPELLEDIKVFSDTMGLNMIDFIESALTDVFNASIDNLEDKLNALCKNEKTTKNKLIKQGLDKFFAKIKG